MSDVAGLDRFREELSAHIGGLVPSELCSDLTEQLASVPFQQRINLLEHLECPSFEPSYLEAIQKCTQYVFTKEVDDLLRGYFEGDFQIFCCRYDKVDSSGEDYRHSCLWHVDGGIPKTLKLFVYLNPVSSHGGNTLIIDKARTQKLRESGALPVKHEYRLSDLSATLSRLGLSCDYSAYELKCGDILLFNPLLLAHKCHLPKSGRCRHTICYTITPPI